MHETFPYLYSKNQNDVAKQEVMSLRAINFIENITDITVKV